MLSGLNGLVVGYIPFQSANGSAEIEVIGLTADEFNLLGSIVFGNLPIARAIAFIESYSALLGHVQALRRKNNRIAERTAND